MSTYDIVLTHGPVQETKYLGDDTVSYILEDGRVFNIQFSKVTENGVKYYKRLITVDDAKYMDMADWDCFNEDLTCEDFAQWTADNFSEEILECLHAMPSPTN